MNGPIRKIAIVIFAAMALLILDVTYIQAIAGPDYRDDPRNPRVQLSQSSKERGVISAADGSELAISTADPAEPSRFVRVYPEGPLFAHTVGFSTVLFGDWGLEDAYASDLRSKRDLTVSDLIDALLGRDLRPQSLELSLVPDLQAIAAEALGDQAGAVVAIDPRTGAVLAMYSSPSFDPNSIVDVTDTPAWDELSTDPAQPLKDRASRESYAPGSTFKIVVAAAALENGIAGPDSTFPNGSQIELPQSTATISNFGGSTCGSGTEVTLAEALQRSCNTVFALLGMDLGPEALQAQAEAFGFNRDLPFEWNVLTSAFPTADEFAGDLAAVAQSSIGERDVQATPLLMASIAAAVANGGEQMEPYLVQRIYDSDGQVVFEREPRLWSTPISPAAADVLTSMMEAVVERGTGTRAAVPGVRIAGKTGTAEASGGVAPHAWFVGFGPVEDPTIAVAVVVENGGDAGESATGGAVAAPIAQQILEYGILQER